MACFLLGEKIMKQNFKNKDYKIKEALAYYILGYKN
jgi:hypothetical protein